LKTFQTLNLRRNNFIYKPNPPYKIMAKEKATFGAGCFWHIELEFSKLQGVLKAESGYMGGKAMSKVTYEQVCSNTTGHAEVVQVTFDNKKISYSELLKTFWKIHNPTTLNRQGMDIGTQYRSVIFYHNEKQKTQAKNSLKEHQKTLSEKILTKIVKASKFHKAEEYHQKYLLKRGRNTC